MGSFSFTDHDHNNYQVVNPSPEKKKNTSREESNRSSLSILKKLFSPLVQYMVTGFLCTVDVT